LDEDVAQKLIAEARKSGRTFKEVVNNCLRLGLNARRAARPASPFKVRARRLGQRPGVAFDDVEALLDQIDGTGRR